MIRAWLSQYLKFKTVSMLLRGRLRYLALPMLAIAGYRAWRKSY